MQIRWRWPPKTRGDNARHVPVQPDAFQQPGTAGRLLPSAGHAPAAAPESNTHRMTRIERGVRILKNKLNIPAQRLQHWQARYQYARR
jgi:hypothetical protein